MQKYFVYSRQEFEFKKDLADRNGKTFTVGNVIINGKRHDFTSVLSSKNCRFSDAIYFMADTDKVKYTMPVMR
jgi:hypothetical protein